MFAGATVSHRFFRHTTTPARHLRHHSTWRFRPCSPDHPGHWSFDGDHARAHTGHPRARPLWPIKGPLRALPDSDHSHDSPRHPLHLSHFLGRARRSKPELQGTSSSRHSRPPPELPLVPGGRGDDPWPFLIRVVELFLPYAARRRHPAPCTTTVSPYLETERKKIPLRSLSLRLVLTAGPHSSGIFSPVRPEKPSWAGPLGFLRAARCQSSLKKMYIEKMN
jgi:hypothetical protein